MEKQTTDINVEIRELDRETNDILNMLKSMRGVPKWQIIREALVEYGEKHKSEILLKMTKRGNRNVR